ncbi:hypothetical protein WDU94_015409 [Cyamophila willieti]
MKFLYKVLLNIIVMSATESDCKNKLTAQKKGEVFHHMQEVGCCDMCAHLYSGHTSYAFYEKVHKEHIQHGTEGKKLKTNPCVSCLGLLHSPFKENITDRIISEIKQSDNDYDSFNLALTLPISYQLRAHSLAYYVRKHYPKIAHTFGGKVFPWMTVKNIFKVTTAPIIAKSVGRTLNPNSELTINVKLTYSNDGLESSKLLELCPSVFGFRQRKCAELLFSKKTLYHAFHRGLNIELRNFSSYPPNVPNHPLVFSQVNFNQSPMYCAGRYNKYSRTLPHARWIMNGKRMLNTSVQELFSKDVQALFKAQDYTFSSSGREDVDVRMLGNGRPFSLELINPMRTKVPQKEIDDLMERLNKEHATNIKLNDMQIISKDDVKYLKKGEQSETKIYEALCVSKKPLTDELLSNLTSCVPLVIEQKTPVRDLSRRANMVRYKTIYSMNITPVPHSSTNQTYFCVKLKTQSGTYVKEFVTGDFGRTTPSLRSLLNDPDIDVLALDVLNVDLDWPPKKKQILRSREKTQTNDVQQNTQQRALLLYTSDMKFDWYKLLIQAKLSVGSNASNGNFIRALHLSRVISEVSNKSEDVTEVRRLNRNKFLVVCRTAKCANTIIQSKKVQEEFNAFIPTVYMQRSAVIRVLMSTRNLCFPEACHLVPPLHVRMRLQTKNSFSVLENMNEEMPSHVNSQDYPRLRKNVTHSRTIDKYIPPPLSTRTTKRKTVFSSSSV